ncbi:MAG TPA: hypothetical protein VKC63_00020 [Solirubrobacterales bacterium]|nr:hypothetical protein [Solirubrobacterales bacterium]
MSTLEEHLPHIDEHSTVVAANSGDVWEALLRVVEGSFGSAATGRVARLLGCAEVDASGPRPLAAGSALPGFHVEHADRPRKLALAGSHRFSDYALIFRLEGLDASRTCLHADTRAVFPGAKGAVYRTLVIRTRGHVLVTRRLLKAVKQRAERA